MLKQAKLSRDATDVADPPPPVQVFVTLPHDRATTGFIMLIAGGKTLAGPFRVLGKADDEMAAKKGNPDRDPTQPFGDTPTGDYTATLGTRAASYGPNGVIELSPASGNALTAEENGRDGLLIHGGKPNKLGKLRPTYGCLRVADDDMGIIMNALRDRTLEKVSVVEDEPPPIQDLPDFPPAQDSAGSACDGGGEYIANLHTGEVHLASAPCAWVHLISEEHRQSVSGLPEGFSWCEHCQTG